MIESDLELLHRYAREASDDAFTLLVRRHLDLVYSAALRQVRQPHLAEEVAQSVFLELSQSARQMKPGSILTAWLYQVTRRRAIDAVRKESRRQMREHTAMELADGGASAAEWSQIEPLLDEAMQSLGEKDRSAILLRYFENKSLREVGDALGTSEDAAQKRVSRALEGLRHFFAGRKIAVHATLATVIAANAVHAAPPALTTTVSTAALFSGTAVHITPIATAIAMTTSQKILVTAALTAAIGTGIYETHRASQLDGEVRALREQAAAFSSNSPGASAHSRSVGDNGTHAGAPLASNPQSTPAFVAKFLDAWNETNSVRRMGRVYQLLESITPDNARQIVEAAMKEPSGGPDHDYFVMPALFAAWAHADRKNALAFAQNLPKGTQREQALTGVLNGWSELDFDAANKWVEALPNGVFKNKVQQSIIQALAESDPDLALKRVLEKGKGETITPEYAYSIFPALTQRDPKQAADLAASLPAGEFRVAALRLVSEQWGDRDREGMLKWIDGLPEGSMKEQTLSNSMTSWMHTDFDSAFTWLEKQPASVNRNNLVGLLTFTVSNDSPEDAIRLVDLMASTSGQNTALYTIGRQWARRDPHAAQQWAQSQTDPGVKQAVLTGAIAGTASVAPEQAAALALQLPDDHQRQQSLNKVAQSWTSHEPVAAANWAVSLKDADTRKEAMNSVMSNWINNDPASALKWFSGVPAGKERDESVSNFTANLVLSNPKLAIQWAQSIQDARLRVESVESLARNWLESDSANATAWIANSELPADTKKKLLDQQ